MDNFQRKTPPKCEKRNEESCGETSRLVVVPVIVKVVPIHIRTVAIAIEIRNDTIAILVQHERARYHPQHHPSKFSRSQG